MCVLAEFFLTAKLLLANYQIFHTVINNCSFYFTKQKAHCKISTIAAFTRTYLKNTVLDTHKIQLTDE